MSEPNLTPEDIDGLEEAANEQAGVTPEQERPQAAGPAKTGPSSGGSTDSDIRSPDDAGELLDQVEADLNRAIAGEDISQPPGSDAAPFAFRDLDSHRGSTQTLPLDALQDVELDLRIELGRTELLIEDVMKLGEGSVVQLDKLAGDPVDILVNGKLIARGEVLVLNDNFCVRVAEILTPEV